MALTIGPVRIAGVISLKRMDRRQVSRKVRVAFGSRRLLEHRDRLRGRAGLIAANPQTNCTYFAEVFQDNPGSARVLTNAGFEYLGDAEAFSVARGTTAPTWTYIKKLD
jgi:hypothetical protein